MAWVNTHCRNFWPLPRSFLQISSPDKFCNRALMIAGVAAAEQLLLVQ